MTKIYLWISPQQDPGPALNDQELNFNLPITQSLPAVHDIVLVVEKKGDEPSAILPVVGKIQEMNKQQGTCSVAAVSVYMHGVPFQIVRDILQRPSASGYTELETMEYDAIIREMGGTRPFEAGFVAHLKQTIAARGYYFDDETVKNYHICLKTRPFAILAGLSGTGKSKLSQFYAAALGGTTQNDRYLRLAVRPNWNDDRFLLGYLNTLTDEYMSEPALSFLMRAERDREHMYVLCLDEMNLAHVEYYFSQFLSALEEEEPRDRIIYLLSDDVYARLQQRQRDPGVEPRVIIPPNVLFTGTINVDETTQPISDKVIDRANTIEFFSVDLDRIPERHPLPEPIDLAASAWQSYRARVPDSTFTPQIVEIGKILNRADMGLGYRVLIEINRYIANSKGLLEPLVALDLQVKQRILPRVRGSDTEQTRQLLQDLVNFTKQHKLGRTHQRLEEMQSRLKRDGYTSFWR